VAIVVCSDGERLSNALQNDKQKDLNRMKGINNSKDRMDSLI